MKIKFLALLLILVPTVSLAEYIGKGCTTAEYIDYDCDGYGVGAPLGADIDDNNINKHSAVDHADALTYIPSSGDIFYISTTGNNSTGVINDVSHPFATVQGIANQITAGDIVVYRGGSYNVDGIGAINSTKGTVGNPVTFMAYPGESPVITRYNAITGPNNNVIGGSSYHNMVYDGLIIDNAASGGDFAYNDNITIKRCVFRNNIARGLIGMQNLDNWLIEDCVFRDTAMVGTHGVYLGSRDQPNSNIVIRGCLFFKNGRTGFQHNGPITGLVFEKNIVHSNNLTGISLVNGVDGGIFRNNLIFNNNKSPIVIQSHHNPDYNEIAATNNNNVFINNTLWVGRDNVGLGPDSPDLFPCVEFNSAKINSYEENARYIGNEFVNNVCVSYDGPFFTYYNILDHYETSYKNNIMHHTRATNTKAILTSVTDGSQSWSDGHPYYYWDFASSFSGSTQKISGNILGSPLLVADSLDYAETPLLFNLRLSENSPAIGAGILSGAPEHDITGSTRGEAIDIGAYEYTADNSGGINNMRFGRVRIGGSLSKLSAD